ncbi:MAG TPA: MlaD family protein [bacterium]|nr:MlaD family protein [bacterium]
MNSEAKVGLLVLGFIALIVFFSFKIGGDRLPWQDDGGYRIFVRFSSIEGLGEKSKVRYAGVEVGYVEAVALQDGQALVTLRLDPDIKIRRNARFLVGSMGLMGEKFVSISGGSDRAELLTSEAVVQGDAAVSMDQLVASLNAIGSDIGEITDSIKSAIGTGSERNKLAAIVDNVEKLSATLAETADDNDEALAKTIHNFEIISEQLKMMMVDNRQNVDGTLSDVRIVAGSLAESMPRITADLQRVLNDLRVLLEKNQAAVNDTVTNVASASRGLDDSMSDLSSIMNKVDSGRGSIGKLVNEDQFHTNLNDALVEVRKAAEQVREFTGRVSDYRVYVGYRGEYLSNSEDWKNTISLKVQPRPDKFYLFEIVGQPGGRRTEEEFFYEFDEPPDFVNDSSSIRFTRTVWDMDETAFSLQFAKIYHRLILRGGIIENTGGFGADLDLFRNKLWLSVDGWDFNRDEDPHLKISGRLNLGDSFFITGGWDDFLLEGDDQDNIFFGAGLSFEDADLKYLLGFLPILGN